MQPQSVAQQGLREHRKLPASVGWYDPCWTEKDFCGTSQNTSLDIIIPCTSYSFLNHDHDFTQILGLQTPLQTCTDLISVHTCLITSQGSSSAHVPLLAAPLKNQGRTQQDLLSPRLQGVVSAIHLGTVLSHQ